MGEVFNPHSGNYMFLHISRQIIYSQLMSVIILYN